MIFCCKIVLLCIYFSISFLYYVIESKILNYVVKVSTGQFVKEVIDLGDDSNNDLDIFVPGRVGLDPVKAFSAKKNLSAAFAECGDTEGITSRMGKRVEG
jgi:hypothetical protein